MESSHEKKPILTFLVLFGTSMFTFAAPIDAPASHPQPDQSSVQSNDEETAEAAAEGNDSSGNTDYKDGGDNPAD